MEFAHEGRCSDGRVVQNDVFLAGLFLLGGGCTRQVSPIPGFNAALGCVESSMGGYGETRRLVADDALTIHYSDAAEGTARRGGAAVLISITISGRTSCAVHVRGSASPAVIANDTNTANGLVRARTLVENVAERCTPPDST